ncbi:hypothetical protein E2I00_010445, partial [Balaenoptera physalus]
GSLPQLPPADVMAAPALSWCLSFLVLLLPLAIPRASTSVNDASELTCFYNSRANISCAWSRDGGLQVTTCHIHAQPDKRCVWGRQTNVQNLREWNGSCELLPVKPGSWACNLILGPPDRPGGRWVQRGVLPGEELGPSKPNAQGLRHSRLLGLRRQKEGVRLMSPHSLQVVHIGTHRCNITWNVSQFSHYIQSSVEFEVRTRSPGCSWEDTLPLTLRQNQQWISLEMLAPDTLYELQVRARPQLGNHEAWSPWSQPLAFRTKPAATRKKTPTPPWLGHIMLGLSCAFGFALLVYFLTSFRYNRLWLKKVLKCHIPDPSEFFSQLSSEHGGDFQKWLSSPFPSSSFSPSGPLPEISPLEVLDRDAKATQLLLLQQQDKGSSSSTETSGHSVYFAYDPFMEEPDEGGPGVPEGALLPPLPPPPGEEDAYCTFPPGDDLLLFSPSLLGGPGPPNTALGGIGAGEERLPSAPQEGVPGDWAPQPLGPPTPEAPDLVDLQSPPEPALGEAGVKVSVPSPREGAGFPWASSPGQGQVRAPISCLTLNTDVYLSLQELQDQDPAHAV